MKKEILKRFNDAIISRTSTKTITGGYGETCASCPPGYNVSGCWGGNLYCSAGSSTIPLKCPLCN